MIKSCVIGWPITHSRSPLIHEYWLRKYAIAGSYTRKPVNPGDLPDFLSTLTASGYAGCNCTIPHKEAAFRLVPAADAYTNRVGAINTVFTREGKLFGTNTDGEGFLANLAAAIRPVDLKTASVIILGAGGAALAIAGALIDAGVSNIAIANRTPGRVEAVKTKLGDCIARVPWSQTSDALADCRLLITTTSLGMTGQPPLDLDIGRLPATAIVADIVYTPLTTPLLDQAKAQGNTIVDGLGMLLHQAVRGFELWFGVRPEVTNELYDLVARDVDRSRPQ